MKKIIGLLLLLFSGSVVFAHEGHHDVTTFEPPHNGAFAKMAGHYAEVFVAGGKIYFCFLEPNGEPAGEVHNPKNITVKVTAKGMKPVVLKAPAAEHGCASWDFTTTAKKITVVVSAVIEGKPSKATLNYEMANKLAEAIDAKAEHAEHKKDGHEHSH